MGRLTRDPEVRYSQGEKPTAVARFSFAVPRRFKQEGQLDCDFISCIAFGKQAEFIEKYTMKGMKLLIEGRWQTGNYTNKDGQKIYTNDCVVESCEFAESKNSASNSISEQSGRPEPSVASGDGFMNIPDNIDDELPFS